MNVAIKNGVSIRARSMIRLENNVEAEFISFHGLSDGKEHLALVFKEVSGLISGEMNTEHAPIVRLHSECLTGDVFKSQRCDCGDQLKEAIKILSESGGILLYMRQEGRGIGLYNKLDAYKIQIEEGLDTYAANRRLNFMDDERDYSVAADMLMVLGVSQIRLLTNNPDKINGLKKHGLVITSIIPTGVFCTAENKDYLRAKKFRIQSRHQRPKYE